MINCKSCDEYQALDNGICPICNWKTICDDVVGHVAEFGLIVECKKPKHKDIYETLIKNIPLSSDKLKLNRIFLNEINNFYDLKYPEKALPMGSNKEENIKDITIRIKKVAWEEICKILRESISDIRTGEYIKLNSEESSVLNELSNISFRPFTEQRTIIERITSAFGLFRGRTKV